MKRIAIVCLVLGMLAWPGRAEEVTGRVVGPDGKALPAARVFFSSVNDMIRDWHEVELGQDGIFRVEVDMEKAKALNFSNKQYAGRIIAWSKGLGLGCELLMAKADNEIRLNEPREVSGSLRNEDGEPIAGVDVRVDLIIARPTNAGKEFSTNFFYLPDALKKEYTTRSDSKEQWKIGGLPQNATILVELDSSDYLPARGQFESSGEPSPMNKSSLTTRRAGAISGKVVNDKGAPVADVTVTAVPQREDAKDNWGGVAKSDAEGRFQISRLKPGLYNLALLPLSARLRWLTNAKPATAQGAQVAKAIEGVRVTAAKTVQARDLIVVAPAWIKGRVLNRATDEPVAGVAVGAYGAGSPRSGKFSQLGITDADGRYEIAVVPGPVALFAFQDDFRNPPPAQGELQEVRLELAPGGTKAQSLFITPRFLPLEGIVVDENGAPVDDIRLLAEKVSGNGYLGQANAEGKFRFERLDVGTLGIAISHEDREKYDLISPTSISLPLRVGEKLKVVVRRVPLVETTGRVVTTGGAPVEGATIRYRLTIKSPDGDGWTMRNATSDAEGRFSLGQSRVAAAATLRFQEIKKNGFRFSKGGEVSTKDGAPVITDIVLQHLTREVAGIVKDQNGGPVAGVQIRGSGDSYQQEAISDAQGRFKLGNQPDGEIEVFAVKGLAAVRLKVAAGKEVALTLPDGRQLELPAVAKAVEIFQQQAASGSDGRSIANSAHALAPLAPEAALALLVATPADKHFAAKSADEASLSVLASLATQRQKVGEAQWLWARSQLDKIQNDLTWLEAAAFVAEGLGARDAQVADAIWLQAGQRRAKVPAASQTMAIAFQAAIAARLKRPEAETLFQEALISGKGQEIPLVRPFALGNPQWVEAAFDTLDPMAQVGESNLAIYTLSPWNPEGARRILERMAGILAAQPEATRKLWSGTLAGSSKYVIRALGPSDAPAAHKIARRVDDDWNRASTLALAAEFGTSEERIAMVRETSEENGPMRMSGTFARLGALLASDAPDEQTRKVSEEMFARSMKIIEENRQWGGDYGISIYAFYEAAGNPATARLRLEGAWAKYASKAQAAKKADADKKPDEGGGVGWEGVSISSAMAAIDPERALEMAREIPADKGDFSSPRATALANIGRIVLTPLTARWRFPWGDESGFDVGND